jgi:uncharacterized membrane protein YhfC
MTKPFSFVILNYLNTLPHHEAKNPVEGGLGIAGVNGVLLAVCNALGAIKFPLASNSFNAETKLLTLTATA